VAPAFSGDGPVFVGGDDQDANGRVRGGDIAFPGIGIGRGGVFTWVEMDAGVGEVFAGGGADLGAVFADTGGEDESVQAAEGSDQGADLTAQAMDVDVEGEGRLGVAVIPSGLDGAQVFGDAGDAAEAGAFVEGMVEIIGYSLSQLQQD